MNDYHLKDTGMDGTAFQAHDGAMRCRLVFLWQVSSLTFSAALPP